MEYYRVRLTIEQNIPANSKEDAIDAIRKKYGVGDDCEADVLTEYRMPVRYNCCEEGYTYGYEYKSAKNLDEARFKFRSEWIPDIEADPCFEDIEFYDEEYGEWL